MAVSGPFGQVDGQLAQAAFQVRVGGVEHGQRRGGQGPLAGWQQGVEHRFAGQRVPEAEGRAVRRDQHLLHRELQRLSHQGLVLAGHGGQQPPVEVAAEDGRGLDHRSLRGAEPGQPLADGLGERLRQPGRGQQVLHQQRHSFGRGLDPAPEFVGCVREAGLDHAGHVLVAEPVEPEGADAGPAPQAMGDFQCARRWAVPQGEHEQQRLALEVLAQVLHQGHGVRVGPVQVLQADDQALGCEPPEQLDQRLTADSWRGVASA